MKPLHFFAAVIISVLVTFTLVHAFAEDSKPSSARFEYVTIRWAGKENTHVIRNGEVEFIGNELRKAPKPDRADDRSFYMNLAMNGLAKEGFEFVGISNDDIVMKRLSVR